VDNLNNNYTANLANYNAVAKAGRKMEVVDQVKIGDSTYTIYIGDTGNLPVGNIKNLILNANDEQLNQIVKTFNLAIKEEVGGNEYFSYTANTPEIVFAKNGLTGAGRDFKDADPQIKVNGTLKELNMERSDTKILQDLESIRQIYKNVERTPIITPGSLVNPKKVDDLVRDIRGNGGRG
jgi:hypothetical protein